MSNIDETNLREETLLAHYVNEEPFEVWHLYCSHIDYSGARSQGVAVHGVPPADTYRIKTVFTNGRIAVRDLKTREEANEVFKKIMRLNPGKWIKV